MKKIRFMLFALLAMLYATNADAFKGNNITSITIQPVLQTLKTVNIQH